MGKKAWQGAATPQPRSTVGPSKPDSSLVHVAHDHAVISSIILACSTNIFAPASLSAMGGAGGAPLAFLTQAQVQAKLNLVNHTYTF